LRNAEVITDMSAQSSDKTEVYAIKARSPANAREDREWEV